jgi:hypothetical protein
MAARLIVSVLVRIIFASIHIAIIVPFGLITSIPPLMYWFAQIVISPKHYNVDKLAPFLSREENLKPGKFRRPKILFDGCAWSFGFELGVCQHLLKVSHCWAKPSFSQLYNLLNNCFVSTPEL